MRPLYRRQAEYGRGPEKKGFVSGVIYYMARGVLGGEGPGTTRVVDRPWAVGPAPPPPDSNPPPPDSNPPPPPPHLHTSTQGGEGGGRYLFELPTAKLLLPLFRPICPCVFFDRPLFLGLANSNYSIKHIM